MNAMKEKYAGQPFEILGFPCSQFLNQEPGANASEILATLKYIRPGGGFVPNFKQFLKSKVNGGAEEDENPIYTFLKNSCEYAPRKAFSDTKNLLYKKLHPSDIRWNFEKFLVDHNGTPIRRYRHNTDPWKLVPDIDEALRKLKAATGSGGGWKGNGGGWKGNGGGLKGNGGGWKGNGGSWKGKGGKTPNWARKDRIYLKGK